METPSVGLYPSREGHQSFYPWIPAHFQKWKLHPLAHIPPGRGTGVFIHGSLHISRHGNSVHWPVSLQGGAPEFLSTDPCTFPDMETPSIGLYSSREGSRVFIHRSLHISGHGNSVCWPISLQGGALEFLSMDPCTFPDMETPSIGLYPFREGQWSFYPWIPVVRKRWVIGVIRLIRAGEVTGVREWPVQSASESANSRWIE